MKIWRNLFWKEWHEQKWKLLALTTIALSICVAMLFQDLGNVAFSLCFTHMAYALLAPILMGMGVCAGEHATGVIHFVRAQPVPMRRVASVRWIAGGVRLADSIALCDCDLLDRSMFGRSGRATIRPNRCILPTGFNVARIVGIVCRFPGGHGRVSQSLCMDCCGRRESTN